MLFIFSCVQKESGTRRLLDSLGKLLCIRSLLHERPVKEKRFPGQSGLVEDSKKGPQTQLAELREISHHLTFRGQSSLQNLESFFSIA